MGIQVIDWGMEGETVGCEVRGQLPMCHLHSERLRKRLRTVLARLPFPRRLLGCLLCGGSRGGAVAAMHDATGADGAAGRFRCGRRAVPCLSGRHAGHGAAGGRAWGELG
jgi:hypothetical protein